MFPFKWMEGKNFTKINTTDVISQVFIIHLVCSYHISHTVDRIEINFIVEIIQSYL